MTGLIIGFIGGLAAGIIITFLFYRKVAEKAVVEIIQGMENLGIIIVNEDVLAEKLAEYGSTKELTKRIIKEVSKR